MEVRSEAWREGTKGKRKFGRNEMDFLNEWGGGAIWDPEGVLQRLC